MSRSRKKTPVRAITTAPSEKKDKQAANRKHRRLAKEKLGSGEGELPPKRQTSNVWDFSKDGKTYDAEMADKDLRK